jgi:HlyD family secretion protein
MQKYRQYILPFLAAIGLFFAIFMVVLGRKKAPIPPIEFPPPKPPYEYYIAGSGMIEPASEEIAIGVPFTNTITDIFVKKGEKVLKDTPLFKLDTSTLEAQKKEAEARKLVAEANYVMLVNRPRIEEVYPKEDSVLKYQNEYENQKLQYELFDSVKDKRALSLNELNQRYYNYQISKYALKQAVDELSLLKAGTWIYDLNIAKAEITLAEESIKVVQADIDRSIIKAPMDGTILQIKAHIGETAQTIMPEETVMVFGALDPLHIRVDIDEEEVWRVEKNSPGKAFVRGNSFINVDLDFLYIEPLMIPKKSLTGDNTERVDTRVLQIIYKLEKQNLPIFTGQIMDVFIKARNPTEQLK